MGIANLAMATGNVGREGVGVNPLRGHNNVQGSCDIGSFAHELPGCRPVSGTAVRIQFEAAWGVELQSQPTCASRTCSTRRSTAASWASTAKARTSSSRTPTPSMWRMRSRRWSACIVVQDLFLNETAKYAHVFLPGLSFLEKDGTFTNAERRISRVRKVMPPAAKYADWAVTVLLSNALGYPMNYRHPSEIMAEIAALTPTFAGVSYDLIDRQGSVQWPCNAAAPTGTPTMHIDRFVRGKSKFIV